jgi:hypothetical protein
MTTKQPPTIEEFAALIAPELLPCHGRVFYSGRDAFSRSGPVPLYVLGLNPGGDPQAPTSETIEKHNKDIMAVAQWSAYCDESWEGKGPGMHRMQPRVRSMFCKLNIDLRQTPASNLIFVRTRRERHLRTSGVSCYEELCWKFHEAVIERLSPRVILCFGRTAGLAVLKRLRKQLNESELLVDCFVEQNSRRWKSEAWKFPSGRRIIIATHPSVADWTKPATNPTPLVARMLE